MDHKSETPNSSLNYPKLRLRRRVGLINLLLGRFGFCNPRLSSHEITSLFSAVGEDKVIDVIDVHTQETIVMNVKEFCQAFETPVEERTSTLNCLGLEVSELPLGKFKP